MVSKYEIVVLFKIDLYCIILVNDWNMIVWVIKLKLRER